MSDIERRITEKGYTDYLVHGPRTAHDAGLPAEYAWHYATGQEAARQSAGIDAALRTVKLHHGPGASYSYHDGYRGAVRMRA